MGAWQLVRVLRHLNVTFTRLTLFPILLWATQVKVDTFPTAFEGVVRLHCIRAVAESEDGGE